MDNFSALFSITKDNNSSYMDDDFDLGIDFETAYNVFNEVFDDNDNSDKNDDHNYNRNSPTKSQKQNNINTNIIHNHDQNLSQLQNHNYMNDNVLLTNTLPSPLKVTSPDLNLISNNMSNNHNQNHIHNDNSNSKKNFNVNNDRYLQNNITPTNGLHISSPTDMDKEIQNILNSQSDDSLLLPTTNPQLLTSLESNAIENFLDSLINSHPSPISAINTNNNNHTNNHTASNVFDNDGENNFHHSNNNPSHNHTFILSPAFNSNTSSSTSNSNIASNYSTQSVTTNNSSALQKQNMHIDQQNQIIKGNNPISSSSNTFIENKSTNIQDSNNDKRTSHNNSNELKITNDPPSVKSSIYLPNEIELPELKIDDSEMPSDIRSDPKKVKKWRHVNAERQRRNLIKSTFENLISLVKFPRYEEVDPKDIKNDGEKNLITFPMDKRIPKHISLSYILQDMKGIISANEQLEFLLNTILE
ncbi:hypothetical protein Kpol_1066p47 [Vanderwaltozyma polyspora DSM 70294]|uniref:INO2 bHLH domain-containing protein n=1 Tax=Vanderwaltozyma polyspora (strain ATCC 22028 / DSM 70294 / BCRC 21397 / CBS 2163 / NBRC 10782 / NRRL Y-8283 / UCD 57-17) TaxID=436907 RepID=A7TMR6_VANPO|nr:uncharacterized protein Kpol_1066p47 [Vanderwaltozyma polyspora DSM 70294]EDO16480.1 hypothetical protein Kpol_1066p47 [Vanderwaltozyma polyspora DSM 70294]